MTVHAAKGLEFPVVFAVNLSRGTGGRRDPIRVGTDADGLEALVAVGDFQSEADEDASAREQEETKRLLYVALTRARDRLYLGAVLKDGRVQPGRGSLAEVCPASLLAAMSGAAAGVSTAQWHAASGRSHTFRLHTSGEGLSSTPDSQPVPLATATALAGGQPDLGSATRDAALDDLGPSAAIPGFVNSVTAARGTTDRAPVGPARPTGRSDRLLGTLVHRLVQTCGLREQNAGVLATAASRLLLPSESVDLEDRTRFLGRAVSVYQALVSRPEVIQALDAARIAYEVPFSFVDAGGTIRGTIDCLLMHDPRNLTVLEFKTGRQQPEHVAQAELYRRAVAEMFPGAAVRTAVVYAEVPD